ncbi:MULTISPECIES: hypothetical protein [Novosphingobium]|jgi:hypothetical protein|uniref:Uncharacterized protein n=1 Tax=Novosphingobium panipatense TaxID=428991 RepID=A0ABY1QYS1_9SPHN|nr:MULTISPECIES: hypothetical protein [Novosphingobium]SMP82858.1 hypothetical protein SAMN06296065_13012 [Novosphingobium panipatense]
MAEHENTDNGRKSVDENNEAVSGRADTTEQVEADIGAVQGSAPDEDMGEGAERTLQPGSPKTETPPDSGEIEWARQVVKKPPHA